jgi:hypothetical protein
LEWVILKDVTTFKAILCLFKATTSARIPSSSVLLISVFRSLRFDRGRSGSYCCGWQYCRPLLSIFWGGFLASSNVRYLIRKCMTYTYLRPNLMQLYFQLKITGTWHFIPPFPRKKDISLKTQLSRNFTIAWKRPFYFQFHCSHLAHQIR